jgi:hypothetical protein
MARFTGTTILLLAATLLITGSSQRITPGPAEVYGRIQFVDAFPDVKVKVVTALPDLRVKRVRALANKPGEWQIVDSLPDYRVQIVDAFPDFTIQWVDAFPGKR